MLPGFGKLFMVESMGITKKGLKVKSVFSNLIEIRLKYSLHVVRFIQSIILFVTLQAHNFVTDCS